MAAVVDALVPLVVKMLKEMATREVRFLLGVSGDVKKLEKNMKLLRNILTDAERKRINDETAQEWVRMLKDAMYDATDTIDLCHLEAEQWRESKGGTVEENVLGCCQPLIGCMQRPGCDLVMCGSSGKLLDFFRSLFFCLRNPVFAHDIGMRIKNINEQLDGICKDASNFSPINLVWYPDNQAATDGSHRGYIHTTTSEINQLDVVGKEIKRDTNMLVTELTDNNNNWTSSSSSSSIKVVSIVGDGGIGKSTLAQCIFNDNNIKKHFRIRIWLSITKNLDKMGLLRSAITHAGGEYTEGDDQCRLQQILTGILSTRRFLVVMDDVWDDLQAWSDDVLRIPIENAGAEPPATGSRVLITTRFNELAQWMKADFYTHEVTGMNVDDAWSLLTRQLSRYQVQRINAQAQLRDTGKEIVQWCGGLPLAIKVMGGLLCKRQPVQREWTDVLNSLKKSNLPKELDSRLYLSYDDLSPQLKQCFLYYSLLRNDRSIPMSAVIYMWISEGFVLAQEPEETAARYHEELISRNLIEPSEQYRRTGYECIMHDVVRSFAQYMARDELLVVHDNNVAGGSNDGHNNNHVRRISTEQSLPEVEWGVLKNHEKLRTLIIDSTIKFGPFDSLTSFLCLRVLHITSKKFDGLVESLCDLKHLRSLHLENTDISSLPNGIGKLRFLQYIMLLNCKNLDNLPNSIVKLVRLRALWLDGSSVSIIPKGFGKLTNVRELLGFPSILTEMGEEQPWCSLQELGPLSELRQLRIEGLDNVSHCRFAEEAMINSKTHLNCLHLNCKGLPAGSANEIEEKQRLIMEVFDMLSPPSNIETLCMHRYFGCRLPEWLSSGALSREGNSSYTSLRQIELVDLTCCTHLPDGLCWLPVLEFLVIDGAPAIKHIGPEFQAGRNPPFPRLKYLRLEGMSEWEDWTWNHVDHARAAVVGMPDLEHLHIRDCGKLRRLPTGLANTNRRSLKKMDLCNLTSLTAVEQFPSVVQLHVCNSPNLQRITGFSSLQVIGIVSCPGLQELGGFAKLDTIELLVVATMQAVPQFLHDLNARYLNLVCGSRQLYDSLLQHQLKLCNIDEADISYL